MSKSKTPKPAADATAACAHPEPAARPATDLVALKADFEKLNRAELSPLQEELADLCADLIVAGGSAGDINGIVEACLDHKFRRYYEGHRGPIGEKSLEKSLEKSVSDGISDAREKYLDDLANARHKRRELPEADRPEPAAASERIRRYMRDTLKALLDGFLADGTPEELRLLHDVLITRNSTAAVWNAPGYDVIPFAEAFEKEMQSGHSYVRVPFGMTAEAETYIAAVVGDGDEDASGRLGLVNTIFYEGLRKLDVERLENVRDFCKVAIEYVSNGITPIEDLILNLPMLHVHLSERGGLAPDEIVRQIEQAREFWEDNQMIAERALRAAERQKASNLGPKSVG